MKRRVQTVKETRPRILIVGGEDVHARIELMKELRDEFDLAAAGTDPSLQERFDAHGLDYFSYALARGTSPLGDLRALASLTSLIRRLRPDLVHAFDTKPCVYARLAARWAGVPVVIGTLPGLGSLYVGNSFAKRLIRGVYEKLQRVASHVADLTIFQNRDDAREFVEGRVVPSRKTTIIPGSGVRTDVYDPSRFSDENRRRVRQELGVPVDAVVVTMVSRVIRSKGVEEFAAAAQELTPRVRFVLIGPADDASMDRFTQAELDDLRRVVIWPGRRNDIAEILAASDVFTLPSFYREGIPRVLLEAASMGLPLVTTRSPGCAEVVEESRNGFLVPVRDAASLVSALQRLTEDEPLRRRFGDASRKLAVTRFSLSVIAAQTRRVYQRLLGRAASQESTAFDPILAPSSNPRPAPAW